MLVLIGVERPRSGRLFLAALFCALSIGSKQTSVFLIPAQLVYLLHARQRGVALRYLLSLVLIGGGSAIVGGVAFGWRETWLNLVAIPARLPWATSPTK